MKIDDCGQSRRPANCTPAVTLEAVYFAPVDPHGCAEPGFVRTTVTADCTTTVEQLDATLAPLAGAPRAQAEAPMKVEVCNAPAATPPGPVTLDGQDCDGLPVPATGIEGQLVQSVQPPGQVYTVRLCTDPKDTEKVVMCDPVTGDKVAIISDLTVPSAPVVTLWNLNTAAPYAGAVGDLVSCGDQEFESDPVLMCDSGTVAFQRWVVKLQGEPTGAFFDTDMSGALYTPTGVVTAGACAVNVVDHTPMAMCDGGTASFIRWFEKVNGTPTGVFLDRLEDGTAYAPAGVVTQGVCPVVCTPVTAPVGVAVAWG